jgi:hypothetical protein
MKHCPKCGKDFSDDANFCPVDAGRLEAKPNPASTEDARPGKALGTGADRNAESPLGGRFVVGDRIGGGRTGEVHQATDTAEGRLCAVKFVSPAVFSTPAVLQRTERELKQLERLEHPTVARVLAHGRRGGGLWIATELCAGRALEVVMAETGPFAPQRAARVVLAAGQALAKRPSSGSSITTLPRKTSCSARATASKS